MTTKEEKAMFTQELEALKERVRKLEESERVRGVGGLPVDASTPEPEPVTTCLVFRTKVASVGGMLRGQNVIRFADGSYKTVPPGHWNSTIPVPEGAIHYRGGGENPVDYDQAAELLALGEGHAIEVQSWSAGRKIGATNVTTVDELDAATGRVKEGAR